MPTRISIDNGLCNHLCKDTTGILWNSFLDIAASQGLRLTGRKSFFLANEMEFLEFIGLGTILEGVSSTLLNDIKYHLSELFNQCEPLKLEKLNQTIEIVFELCLKACQSLPKIMPEALLAQYNEHLRYLPSESAKFLDRAISSQYLESLNTNPENVYKQICRNLTWQLVTIMLRSAFNEISTNKHSHLILRFFEQLMAMLHRSAFTHGSPPNFFRVAEAAYLSYMRKHEKELSPIDLAWVQEYIRKYQTGKAKDLADCVYLDRALLGHIEMADGKLQQLLVTVFTMDNPAEVFNRLKLLRNMIEKLKSEAKDWHLNPIYSCKVLCLAQTNGRLEYRDTVAHAIVLGHSLQN